MTSEPSVQAVPTDGTVDGALKRGITGPLLFLFILGDVLGAGIYALVGVLSGILAVRTGDLSRSILLHAGFNLLSAVLLLAT
jgi:membrane protease YdiL (CAAX protease family)